MNSAPGAGLVSLGAGGQDASHATSLRSLGPALRAIRDRAIILGLLLGSEGATQNCWLQNELGGPAPSRGGSRVDIADRDPL
jgi:hypothetical protein